MTEPTPGQAATEYPLFPAGFRLGTSTAAYQVEGAADEDGRGPSIWDTYAHTPGRIVDGSTGDVTCDHYHRYVEDVALMRRLGATGYRLSVSWSRVQPEGTGAVNPAGLAFYDRLVDELLGAGVHPMVTLYHWDLPQPQQDRGGWLDRDLAHRFAEYAALMADTLGDRVEHWVPVNEPNVHTLLGHGLGVQAPGHELMFDSLAVAHHLLLGHGQAVSALRAAGVASVGCANNHAPMWPASDSDADVGATKLFDALWNGMFTEPMLLGRYPADLMPLLDDIVEPGDLATIRQPLDFYGVNYYNPMKVAAAAPDAPMPFDLREVVGYPTTDFGWPVVPEALRELLVLLRARYRAAIPPLMITESGCSYGMGPDESGVVDDQPRIDYLAGHLRAVAKAIGAGVDVRGFYTWSLLDNFEWSEGFTQRFGLVHVDFETGQRTPKRSFDWYAAMIAAQPPADA